MITLVLVPVVYAIFVLDLKWVKWERPGESEERSTLEATGAALQLAPAGD
jgi:hypothetical protein